MMSETLVFLVYVGAAVGLVVLVGCVMTLASIVVGDPDPLAWAKGIGTMFSDGPSYTRREYERQREEECQRLLKEYQRFLKENKP